MEKIFIVKGMMCSHCSARVEKALNELGYKVSVSLEKGEVTVEKDSIDVAEVKNTVEDLGFIVE